MLHMLIQGLNILVLLTEMNRELLDLSLGQSLRVILI
jgi:hypothetical protein